MWISLIILITMIAGFVSQIWTVGIVAMLAGMMCVITGCISIKKLFQTMDWTTVWVVAGALGFASGLSESGAGVLIANTVIAWFGGNVSFFTLLVIFTFLGILCVNFMPGASAMTILAPIALFICTEMGYDGKAMIMALVMTLNICFMTPISMPPITMTLSAGYRFTDYVKFGGILTFIMFIATIASYLIFFV